MFHVILILRSITEESYNAKYKFDENKKCTVYFNSEWSMKEYY